MADGSTGVGRSRKSIREALDNAVADLNPQSPGGDQTVKVTVQAFGVEVGGQLPGNEYWVEVALG